MKAKIVLAFAALGFLAGVIAYYTYSYVVPWVQEILPNLLWAPWFISGLVGAVLTIIIIVIWAYTGDRKS